MQHFVALSGTSPFASNRAMAEWPKTAQWTQEQTKRMEHKRATAKEEWDDRQSWKRQWVQAERLKEATALGSSEGASSSSAAPPPSAKKRAGSANKIRPPYWRLKQEEVKQEEEEVKVEVKTEEEAEEDLPPPRYDPGKATDDLAHHLNRTQTPTSFLPQRHIMMVLGRPVVVLICFVSPSDRFGFEDLWGCGCGLSVGGSCGSVLESVMEEWYRGDQGESASSGPEAARRSAGLVPFFLHACL